MSSRDDKNGVSTLQSILVSLAANRCYACGWALGSCQPFNCSMRYKDDTQHLAEREGWLERQREMSAALIEATSTPSHVAPSKPIGARDGVLCYSPGDMCAGCDHYEGKADRCSYAPSTIAPSERALTDDEISAAWNGAGADRPEAGAADLYLHYMRAVAKAQRAKMLAFMPSATACSADAARLDWLFAKLNDDEIKANIDLVSDAYAMGGMTGIRIGDFRAAIDQAKRRSDGGKA